MDKTGMGLWQITRFGISWIESSCFTIRELSISLVN